MPHRNVYICKLASDWLAEEGCEFVCEESGSWRRRLFPQLQGWPRPQKCILLVKLLVLPWMSIKPHLCKHDDGRGQGWWLISGLPGRTDSVVDSPARASCWVWLLHRQPLYPDGTGKRRAQSWELWKESECQKQWLKERKLYLLHT
jgi:hypothetical protein